LGLTVIALPYALKHMENLFWREARRDERKYKIERGLKFKENLCIGVWCYKMGKSGLMSVSSVEVLVGAKWCTRCLIN